MRIKGIVVADWMNNLPLLSTTEYRMIVEEVCHLHSLDPALLAELLRIELSHAGSGRREGITDQVAAAINHAFRTGEE